MPSTIPAIVGLMTAVSCGPQGDQAAPPAFPADWAGVWGGRVRAARPGPGTGPDAKPMEFAMELRIAPEAPEAGEMPSRWTWTIVYGEGERRQERAYTLIVKDAAKGLYEIDEHNSIVLPATLVNGVLVSPFEVGGSLLVASYELQSWDPPGAPPAAKVEECLEFRIITVASGHAASTGGKDGAPEVRGFPVASFQQARLHRARPAENAEERQGP